MVDRRREREEEGGRDGRRRMREERTKGRREGKEKEKKKERRRREEKGITVLGWECVKSRCQPICSLVAANSSLSGLQIGAFTLCSHLVFP